MHAYDRVLHAQHRGSGACVSSDIINPVAMSALDEPPSTTDTATTPCDTDKEPLLWMDGNYARIPGLLFEFAKWTVREALLQPWYQHRAVLVGRMTYVEDISTIPFMTGTIEDPIERTAQNPCPIGKTRVTEYNDPKSGAHRRRVKFLPRYR